jgi:ABC-type sugar transport system substrate-binding protein
MKNVAALSGVSYQTVSRVINGMPDVSDRTRKRVQRVPGIDIKIVSIDGVKGAFEAMKDGKLNVTVECNPLLGPQLFDLIEAAAAKKEVPKRVATQEGVYEQSQAAAELPKRQY